MAASTLETARLILRGYSPSDIPDLVRLIGSREIAAHTLRIPHPYSEQDAKDFLESGECNDELRFAITLRTDGSLCGGIGLKMNESHHHAELGYWIGVPLWGNGYATEAAHRVLQHGFEVLKLNRIFASHFKSNPASGKVLKKIGMRYEGSLRQHICKWGQFIDLELYGMLSSDWANRHE